MAKEPFRDTRWQQQTRTRPVRPAAVHAKRKRRARRRPSRRPGIAIVGVLLSLFAAVLLYQLYQIQIVAYAANAEKAAALHYDKVVEEPRRGTIYDRNGVELAGTTYVHRIGITPKDLYSIKKDISADEIAAGIAQALELDLGQVQTAMAKKDAPYLQLAKDVPREQAENLRAFINANTLGGIRIDTEARRYYTNGSLASQVLGFCRYDEGRLVGQLGIELQFNSLLTGQPGYTYVERDNYESQGSLPFSVPTSLRAKDGQNLVLNLDINIQTILQEELAAAVSLYEIQAGGSAIVMDPYTGAVLALASWPYFDSSDPTACPPGQDPEIWDDQNKDAIEYLSGQVWRNRVISDTYEPGSTMKAITTAMALEEALVHEKSTVTCRPIKLFNWTINCVRHGGHGDETLEMGFWRSCNPVFAQLSLSLGVERFYTYVRSFGLMDKTGIELPAEGKGILHSQPTELDMATFSYGESSTVTPLQLATAYCSFANGGKLVRPAIVKSVTDTAGDLVRDIKPETVRQVISESTAARLRSLMEGVVLNGTGSPAYVEGYAVAGKTSTSTDDFGDHTLSFAALAPADNPEIVVLIVLNKPVDKELTSKVAAKTCGAVVSRTLEYMGVERIYRDTDVSRLMAKTAVPDVSSLPLGQALRTLADKGLRGEAGDAAMGEATLVKFQWPAAGSELHSRGLVVLYPVSEPDREDVAIPDFRGRTVNECQSLAAESGLNILISGDCLGLAVSQDPLPALPDRLASPTPAPTITPAEPDDDDEPDTPGSAGDVPAPVKLKHGDLVEVIFAAVEEELAQSGASD